MTSSKYADLKPKKKCCRSKPRCKRCPLVLLGGAAGTGKSSLIRTIEAPLSDHAGYIGIGKSSQPAATEELPYRGFAQALTGVIGQLLAESDERLSDWRSRLRAKLGPIAGVVGAVVPELALVIGWVEKGASKPSAT